MNKTISHIREELKKSVDNKTKEGFHRFFKEKVKFYGVKSHLVDKIAKANFLKIKSLTKSEIFTLCEVLLQFGYSEEAWIASSWTYALRGQYQKEVFDYVLKNKSRMPRTALRYAIEKLPPDLRKKAMAK